MSAILDTIAKETSGVSFKTHKLCFDSTAVPSIDYDDNKNITWKTYGETIHHTKAINLTQLSKEIMSDENPLFKYFLDGSRRTYKVDDISYSNQVYPVIAGQIGVGCCKRENRRLSKQAYISQNVIALPRCADKDGWESDLYFKRLLQIINDLSILKKHRIEFSKIMIYDSIRNEDIKLENKGIEQVQDQMTDTEKLLVAQLVKENLLSYEAYLIKDGSLEYRKMDTGDYRELAKIKTNYRYVIGVSKSFNPERCHDRSGKNNSSAIADLKLYHRTPAYMYESQIVNSEDEQVFFAIWYLRIRDKKYTNNPYEGILKIEKILSTDSEINNGIDSELVDYVTANIINERNPVCWGSDARWANHLYPVYLTEKYLKSQFIGSNYFLNMF